MARIDPWGDVYPCLEQHVKVGSIKDQSFSSLWQSETFDRERERLRTGRTCSCWYNNTALIGHYGKLLGNTSIKTVRELAHHTVLNGRPSVFSEKK